MIKNSKKLLLAASIATALIGTASVANACSRLLWETEDHGVFVSRTMDWMEENHPTIDVRAKAQTYSGYDGENAIEWTAKYASIGATLYGIGLIDGFNEVGFSANALFLDEESSGETQDDKAQILNSRVVPYLLDSFATVKEALENIESLQVQQLQIGGMSMRGHYSIQDATGDSAILEYVDGKWSIHHGKEHKVMTNSPEYAEHLKNWEEAKPKSQSDVHGTFEIPGNIISSQRFVWNSYMLDQLDEPSSYLNGISKLDSATYKIPADAANREQNGVMAGYATLYGLAYNLDEKVMQVRYQYGESYTHYFINFNKLNDGENYHIAADQSDLFGDITDRLIKGDGVMAQFKIDK